MKLFIDTSSETIIIGLDGKKWQHDAREGKSQQLLPFLTRVLEEQKKEFSDISEIEVNTGPGSFTGLRVGVSVANTLGWFLKVPVNGKNIEKEGPVEPTYT